MEERVPIESAAGGSFGGSFFRLRGHLAVRGLRHPCPVLPLKSGQMGFPTDILSRLWIRRVLVRAQEGQPNKCWPALLR